MIKIKIKDGLFLEAFGILQSCKKQTNKFLYSKKYYCLCLQKVKYVHAYAI